MMYTLKIVILLLVSLTCRGQMYFYQEDSYDPGEYCDAIYYKNKILLVGIDRTDNESELRITSYDMSCTRQYEIHVELTTACWFVTCEFDTLSRTVFVLAASFDYYEGTFGYLLALTFDGALKWQKKISNTPSGITLVDNGDIMVISMSESKSETVLQLIHCKDGNTLWQKEWSGLAIALNGSTKIDRIHSNIYGITYSPHLFSHWNSSSSKLNNYVNIQFDRDGMVLKADTFTVEGIITSYAFSETDYYYIQTNSDLKGLTRSSSVCSKKSNECSRLLFTVHSGISNALVYENGNVISVPHVYNDQFRYSEFSSDLRQEKLIDNQNAGLAIRQFVPIRGLPSYFLLSGINQEYNRPMHVFCRLVL